jgi:hypothetical protein
MHTHIFLALSRPATGREEEFHRWYDASHLRDVIDLCPGFVAGQRFFAEPGAASPEWPSLAVYQLSSDDLVALHRDVSANASGFTPSNGVFAPDHAAWVYSAIRGEDAALETWLAASDQSCLTLVFLDDAGDGPAAALAGFDTSPILARGDGQRIGENPAWPFLVLARGGDVATTVKDRLAAVAKPAAIWVFAAQRDRIVSHPRD